MIKERYKPERPQIMTIAHSRNIQPATNINLDEELTDEEHYHFEQEWIRLGNRTKDALTMLEGVEQAIIENDAPQPPNFDLDAYLLVFSLANMKWQELNALYSSRKQLIDRYIKFVRSGLMSKHVNDAQAYLTLGHVIENDEAMIELIRKARTSIYG